MQRKPERSMRTTKRKILIDEKIKDDERLLYDQIRLRRINEEYTRFSRAAKLPLQRERVQIAKYGLSAKIPGDSSRMAASKVDWGQTVSVHHTAKECAEIKAYARDKGVKIYALKRFDGDIDLLKEQIDIISNMQAEYRLDKQVTITFDHSMDDDVFAAVPLRRHSHTIIFNPKVLRNREITNKNLNKDPYLAATDIRGIAAHEMGHLIARKYGEKGLEIAQKTYYNISENKYSYIEVLAYLKKTISWYSISKDSNCTGKSFKSIYYKEIIPEVLAKNKTNPNGFSREFVKLLKEVVV